jgi:hypothetical protein
MNPRRMPSTGNPGIPIEVPPPYVYIVELRVVTDVKVVNSVELVIKEVTVLLVEVTVELIIVTTVAV